MKIGDTIPLDGPVDRAELRRAKLRRGNIARLAARGNNNAGIHTARRIIAEQQDQLHRATDPYELAATFLRRRGYIVYDRAIVLGRPNKGVQVGRQVMKDQAAVIAYAAGLGFSA